MNISENFGLLSSKIDAVVKSLFNLSFRVKREIFPMQYAEFTRFLPDIRNDILAESDFLRSHQCSKFYVLGAGLYALKQ